MQVWDCCMASETCRLSSICSSIVLPRQYPATITYITMIWPDFSNDGELKIKFRYIRRTTQWSLHHASSGAQVGYEILFPGLLSGTATLAAAPLALPGRKTCSCHRLPSRVNWEVHHTNWELQCLLQPQGPSLAEVKNAETRARISCHRPYPFNRSSAGRNPQAKHQDGLSMSFLQWLGRAFTRWQDADDVVSLYCPWP